MRIRLICAAVVVNILSFAAPAALAFETKATAAFVIDQTTGTVLLNKNAQTPLPPASMSKLMTLAMTFEAVRDGRLGWDEKLPVSQHAMDYGGSTMFLNTRDRVKVSDLVRGVIVLSGNDACAVLAEAISIDGTEAGFARMMTNRARELGMMNTTFGNSNGWPHPEQRMSMEDLAILADYLIREFPNYYALFSEKEFKFDGRAPANTQNRNPLLKLSIGADGLKTGHTQEAGYGLVGSAVQGDRRVIFVITGLDSAADRASESERLVTWAFRQFEAQPLGNDGAVIGTADVWMGNKRTVGLTVAGEPKILVPVTGKSSMKAYLEYKGPIEAPIKAGDPLADLVIETPGLPQSRVPLVAAENVGTGGLFSRVRTAVTVLTNQSAGTAE
ncbi:MAG: D-alanyl-D-alanine carboxypeptidase family protein [Planktomarina sp.]